MANKKANKRTRTSKPHKIKKSQSSPFGKMILYSIILAVAIFSTYKGVSSCDKFNSALIDYGDLTDVATAQGCDEQIVKYKAMTISFNPKLHIPNWVSWELTQAETDGDVPRAKKFLCDESVAGCADDWDYSYSGYDRGHMAPAADMKWDKEAMKQSFYMTNICPQAGSLNSGSWKRLEDKCRIWAQADSAIVIVSGPIISDKITEFIGDSRVAVPKRFFKVILSPYSNPPRGIGFIMPNKKVSGGMQECAVSIDSVEAVTGHDFFSALPDEIESQVESQCKFHYWSTLRPTRK